MTLFDFNTLRDVWNGGSMLVICEVEEFGHVADEWDEFLKLLEES